MGYPRFNLADEETAGQAALRTFVARTKESPRFVRTEREDEEVRLRAEVLHALQRYIAFERGKRLDAFGVLHDWDD